MSTANTTLLEHRLHHLRLVPTSATPHRVKIGLHRMLDNMRKARKVILKHRSQAHISSHRASLSMSDISFLIHKLLLLRFNMSRLSKTSGRSRHSGRVHPFRQRQTPALGPSR